MTCASEPGRVADPGAQLERTALAWRRTALLVALNGALLARATPALGAMSVVLGCATIMVAALMSLAASYGYRRGRGRTVSSVLSSHTRATRALTCVITVIAVLNLTAVLLHP